MWSNDENPYIYLITDEGIFYNISNIDGFFPKSDEFVEYRFCNYNKSCENLNIFLYCQNSNTKKYFFLDKNFENTLTINIINNNTLNIKSKENDNYNINLLDMIIDDISIYSEINLFNLNSSTEIGDFPSLIKNKPNYLDAILNISDNAKENSGPWYNEEALYAFADINNDEMCELIFFKSINSSPSINECHMFIIYENGEYIDYGTNRSLMKGIEGVKSVLVCTEEKEASMILHCESTYKTEQNSAWLF